MTDYERMDTERSIKAETEKVFPWIANSAIGEWKQSIEKYKTAGLEVDRQIIREIARWDAGKLNEQLKLVSNLVELAVQGGSGSVMDGGQSAGAKLEGIYSESMQSGDAYRQRAAAEVFKSAVLNKVSGDDRFEANRLAKQAERDLVQLRTTEQITEAKQAKEQAFDDLLNVRQELIDTSIALGQGDPTNIMAGGGVFEKAIRMVQKDRQTGRVKIYSETDPEVTGVYWPKKVEAAE